MNEGASILFKCITNSVSLTHLNIANHDRLHRNRLGLLACTDLCRLLQNNKILSILNISDNRIGNQGLNALTPALTEDCSLVSLSLSNNNLDGIAATNIITKYLKLNRNIVKLDLSNNSIGDDALNPLAEALSENATRVKQLLVENCKLTTDGAAHLFTALKTNSFLSDLYLGNNTFFMNPNKLLAINPMF